VVHGGSDADNVGERVCICTPGPGTTYIRKLLVRVLEERIAQTGVRGAMMINGAQLKAVVRGSDTACGEILQRRPRRFGKCWSVW
jgi:hypothetical protein